MILSYNKKYWLFIYKNLFLGKKGNFLEFFEEIVLKNHYIFAAHGTRNVINERRGRGGWRGVGLPIFMREISVEKYEISKLVSTFNTLCVVVTINSRISRCHLHTQFFEMILRPC